ncbi:uncharacterized protein [Procambarus clarkii]|uniref:uncharacterized protein n=1 Tax=Procambarus clarkii TaxID=6728 RepID=UPI0037428876
MDITPAASVPGLSLTDIMGPSTPQTDPAGASCPTLLTPSYWMTVPCRRFHFAPVLKDVAEVHGVLAAACRRSLTTQDFTQRPLKADSLASIQPYHPSGGRDGMETKARGR